MLINHTMGNQHNLHRCPCKGNGYYVSVNLIRMSKNGPLVHRAGCSARCWHADTNGGETYIDRVTNPTVTLIRRNRSENTFPVVRVYRCV